MVKYGETSLASDIWAIGLVAIELYDGHVPLIGTHSPSEAIKLISQYTKPPIERKDRFSVGFRSFLEACLHINPNNRQSTGQLLQHSFLTNTPLSFDIIKRYSATAKRLKNGRRKSTYFPS